jgi:putative nucleotidyltransferase with HDIG domain
MQSQPLTHTVVSQPNVLIDSLVAQVQGFPLDTTIAPMLNALLNDTHATMAEIANTLALDPTIAARAMRMINSAYFGIPTIVTDLTRAVQLMGLDIVRDIGNSSSLLRIFTIRRPDLPLINSHLDGLWRHSIATGVAARLLCQRQNLGNEHVYFSAGLLHDVGKAALLLLKQSEYSAALRLALHERLPIMLAERQVLNFDHAHLGRQLCESWGQPDDVCQAIARHHSVRAGGPDEAFSVMSAAVHVADIVARALGVGWWGDRVMPRLDSAARATLGLNPPDADELMELLDEEYPPMLAHMTSLFPDTIIR